MNSNKNKSDKILKDVGWKIGKVRQDMGLTQEEFAAKIGYARTTLAKLEAGLRDIKSTEIVELAEKLNVSCDYLLGRKMAAAPDNVVQEMVDRYGLSEDMLKILQRLKEKRGTLEEYINLNTIPSKDWESLYSMPSVEAQLEYGENILNMLNLLFTTQRTFEKDSDLTYGEYIFNQLYTYYFGHEDKLSRSLKMVIIHEEIVALGEALKSMNVGI